jgi:hypothetical protein
MWRAVPPDHIRRQRGLVMEEDRQLLVPIGVEHQATLLHEHTRVAAAWPERVSTDVTFHTTLLAMRNPAPGACMAG